MGKRVKMEKSLSLETELLSKGKFLTVFDDVSKVFGVVIEKNMVENHHTK
jgi:hypothetical protein